MTEPRPPQDETTVEEIETPAWDRMRTVTDEMAAAAAAASASKPAAPGVRRWPGIRWLVALVGIIVVVAGSALVVSLAGSRPVASVALGYMPASMYSYAEVRFDLPGDQQQKLASFLHNGKFPGFADQAQITPKVEDIYDRIVRWVSAGKQTYTGNIQPWFSGQVGIGQGLPTSLGAMSGMTPATPGGQPILLVATITDRAKAIDWVTSTGDVASMNRTTYAGADLFENADRPDRFTLGVTDKVLVAGSEDAVKAAIDSNGNGPLAQDPDIKAAFGAVDRDYAVLSVARTRVMYQGLAKLLFATASPGILEGSQIDDTLIAMLPPWAVSTARFEDDALVATSVSPPYDIGYEAKNTAGALQGHAPANTIFYEDIHDVGPTLQAILGKFRALPETKTFFDQFDQALSLFGGFDSVFGWWGDTAIVVAPSTDGMIGGGLLIKPRDAAAADRLLTTIRGFVAVGAANSGVVVRDEDHNGTKITVLDFSKVPGMTVAGLPPGYKAELAWASNADVAVIGYGRDFVASVLDAAPGHSLADDARFKALLNRVGSENITASFMDIAAIRQLVEPLAKSAAKPDEWSFYEKEIQPYLVPFDAVVSATRKDGSVDRATGEVTVH